MSNIAGTSRHQTLFLRAFRKNPAGPPADTWPSPAVFRKWLRRPAFRTSLRSVQAALRFRADFHLASAADHAAQRLAATAQNPEGSEPHDLKKLNDILRLAHLRERFPAAAGGDPEAPLRSPATFARRTEIRRLEDQIANLEEEAPEGIEIPDDDDARFAAEETQAEIDAAPARLAELRPQSAARSQ